MEAVEKPNLFQTINTKNFSLPLHDIYQKYPEIRNFVNHSTFRLDLGNSRALRTYNRLLFKELENLELVIPKDHLIPTAGLRRAIVNIILTQQPKTKSILEIGTGSTAIIAQLLAKRNIKVIATEIDPESIKWAEKNIEKNKNLVKYPIIIIQSNNGIIKDIPELKKYFPIDGVISLPPFYDKGTKKPNKNKGFSGTESELFHGTNENFGKKILEEALELKEKIKFVGILWKNHKHLLSYLRELDLIKTSCVFKLLTGTRIRYFSISYLQ